MEIKISEPILVYAPEMNEQVAKWGVYAIPRMWRAENGELVIRFNGEALVHSYSYGDIPPECKGIEFGKIDTLGNTNLTEINFDFPEREVLVNYKANTDTSFSEDNNRNNEFVDVEEYIQPFIFKSPYMSSLKQLSDGTLVALSTGQNPNVDDRFCSEIYLVCSEDGGKTWKKRATITSDSDKMPYGFGGDGGEVSLAIAEDDSMYCVMRMDMSINPEIDDTKCWGCRFCASFDKGKSWTKPKEIADSSVTPHIVSLKNDVLLVVYGRPGVHFKVSFDKGESWSDSYSIIGKTLTEERESGRSDLDSKYANSCSYSNVFVEKISEDSIIVCYNNQFYPDKNGVNTKAAFVRKITVN